MNNKKILTIITIVIILLLTGIVVWGSKSKKDTLLQEKTLESNIPIYFYGNTCPHCHEVDKWMKENNIEEKIKIIKKEVYDNRQNAEELTLSAKKCGLPIDSIGVPFLFTEGRCLIGTPDIITFLSQKSKINNSTSSAERSEK